MLINKARDTITQFNMLQKDDKVIVGVSGGPDSVALLYCLKALKKDFNVDLFVAHLNHMIRKKAACKDALFVKKTAERLNLPVLVESADVPAIARARRLSIEEAARDARYDFYLRAAKKVGAEKIALAHTEDDQAETVLMRLMRGSGLLGLGGIPPIRRFEDRAIIRPFINISKKEILKFLSTRKIPFKQDVTNIQPIYLRNRVRHKLIPYLEKGFNPEIKKVLIGIAKNSRLDYDYLLRVSKKRFGKYAKCSKDKALLSLKFLDEDIAIRRIIIREAIRKVKGNLNSITYKHWEDLNSLLGKKKAWSINLPDKIVAKRSSRHLGFYRDAARKGKGPIKVFSKLEIPGKIHIPGIERSIEAKFVRRAMDFKSKKSRTEEYFDFDKLKMPLFVRLKKGGDRIVPLGMTRAKRLKKLFIDEKVPVYKRGRIPLVVSQKKIAWVCGVKRSDAARVTNETRRIVKIRIM
jgi:tRNA(Ile)-lysidine synthase